MRDLEELNLLNQLIELGAKAAHAHAQSNSDDGHKGTAAYVQWQELRAEMGELIRTAYAPEAYSVPEDATSRWAAPKYDSQQREWCIAYEAETGFDPMMDDYEAGLQTFAEAAVASLRWYEDHTSDAHLRISSKTIPGGSYDAARKRGGA
ncbi:hypothetical protein [Acidovorax sp.]|uniref:hypothetical protein n=1 Tax=Acidovorax sp. TaxID=1872122 RepID=UPI0025BA801F|nr:hypothetical protein [Acidovorax sp.]MCI5068454.1 hypothetical protein [Acidovorax sp.]